MAKKETAAQRRERRRKAICGDCVEPIDLDKLNAARQADRTYIHYCGRVLHWGGNESEVPTSNSHDDHSSSAWPREGQPTGDA